VRTLGLALFGWLVPGGADLLERRYGRFAIAATLVGALVIGGVVLQGSVAWPHPEELSGVDGFTAILFQAGAASRLLAGLPALLALGGSGTFLEGHAHEYGATLLSLAGVANLLAITTALELRKASR
jgi:hypothetical protein